MKVAHAFRKGSSLTRQGFTPVLGGLLILSLLAQFVIFLVYSEEIIRFPYEVDDIEGIVLNQSLRLQQGKPLYPSIQHYPYINTAYPPLYQWVGSLFIGRWGVSLAPLRAVSLVSTLWISFLLYATVRRKTGGILPALVASLSFLCFPPAIEWASLCRVDLLGIALALTGLTVYMVLPRDRGVWIALPFFCAAFLAKQTLFAAPLAAYGHYFLVKRGKGIGVIATLGGAVLALYLALHIFSGGQFFLHTVKYMANTYLPGKALNSFVDTIRVFPIFFGFSMLYCWFCFRRKRLDPAVIYLAAAFVHGLLSGKVGANMNFWIEWGIAVSLCTGLCIAEILKTCAKHPERESIIGATLLFALIQVGIVLNPLPLKTDFFVSVQATKAEGDRISQYVRETEGPILTEVASWAVLNGKEFLFEPFAFATLYRENLWDDREFIKDIREKRFPLIILKSPARDSFKPEGRFTPRVYDAVREGYEISEKIGYWRILVPRGTVRQKDTVT